MMLCHARASRLIIAIIIGDDAVARPVYDFDVS